MKKVVIFLIVLLLLLHQDVWFWGNRELVGGFMPVGLLYHAGLSLAASITWYLATIYAWPGSDEEEATE
jgi:hypothetical protein